MKILFKINQNTEILHLFANYQLMKALFYFTLAFPNDHNGELWAYIKNRQYCK